MSQDDSDSCGGMEIVEDEIIASPQTNNKNKNNTEDEDIIVDEEIITNKEGSGKVQRRRKSFRPNQFQITDETCISQPQSPDSGVQQASTTTTEAGQDGQTDGHSIADNDADYAGDADSDSGVPDFKCPLCGQVLTCQRDFTSHLRGHNEVKPSPDPSDPTGQTKVYNCCLCGKMLSSFSSLDRHMLVHSGERPFSCQFCGQTFTTNGNMHRHQRTHGKSDQLQGSVNLDVSSTEDLSIKATSATLASPAKKGRKRDLSCHMSDQEDSSSGIVSSSSLEVAAKKTINSCPLCEKTFSSDILLETHVQASHPGQNMRCDMCPVVCPTVQTLNIHKYLSHFQRMSSLMDFKYPTLTPAPSIAQTLQSMTVQQVTAALNPPPPLTKHLEGALTRAGMPALGVTNVPNVMTNNKDKDLADVQSILSIAQNFPGLPDDEVGGGGCGQNGSRGSLVDTSLVESDMSGAMSTTSDGDSSSKKMRLEESENFLDDDPAIKEMKMKGEFPCSLCPAVFPNLRALKGHNKEHLDKAPYRCNVGTCTYSSNDKSTLTRHMRRHTGEKPFECKVCNFGFTTKANCERHLKNKHRKTTREQVRECLIIHETDETEALLNKMQVNGEAVNGSGGSDRMTSTPVTSEPMDTESDNAFRCKVCKLTFMSKFAVIQHGIHTHPEYAKDVDHIAETIGGGGGGLGRENKSPAPIHLFPRSDYPGETEDSPLDLSKEREDDKSIDLTTDDDIAAQITDKDLSPKIIARGFAPSFPMILPGLPGQQGGAAAPNMFYSYLAAMPYLLSQQGLIPGLQKNNLYYGNTLPLPPMDISQLLAAQELAKKQAEFLQQKEAAEALQNLSQAAPAAPKNLSTTEASDLPRDDDKSASDPEAPKTLQACDPDEKLDESMYKMVIKNGVLMKKPKQKRYRTERPYSCQSCAAKFTLRSNMERHIKQQHPECWSGKGRGGRRSAYQSQNLSSMDSAQEFGQDKFDDDTGSEKEEDGLLIIDDKSDKRRDSDSDLASVSRMITSSNQSFPQFLADRASAENDDYLADSEERKSAYSAAPNKIDCPFCFRKFPWTSSLNRHILTHTGEKPYKCTDCTLWFTTKSNRDRHQVRKHGIVIEPGHQSRNISDRPFRCTKCPTSTFSTEENLVKHHYEKHLNIEYTEADRDADDCIGVVDVTSYFKCHICNEEFIHRAETIAHIEAEHNENYKENIDLYESASRIPIDLNSKKDPSDEGLTRVNCIFCPCQFRSSVELSKHVLSHTRLKQYLCDICSKEFTVRAEFIKHKKSHDNNNHTSTTTLDITTSPFSLEENENHGSLHLERKSRARRVAVSDVINSISGNGLIITSSPLSLSQQQAGNGFRVSCSPTVVTNSPLATTTNLGSPERRTKPALDVNKRAKLMDTINRLNMLSAAKAEGMNPSPPPRLIDPTPSHTISAQQLT